jgi:hypothetical protein
MNSLKLIFHIEDRYSHSLNNLINQFKNKGRCAVEGTYEALLQEKYGLWSLSVGPFKNFVKIYMEELES